MTVYDSLGLPLAAAFDAVHVVESSGQISTHL